ncbi:MAG TPA: hypothetical protein VJR47_06525 [Stellaceae bacterium]|nr:hypothetical protein [Stellaceae bacterium]
MAVAIAALLIGGVAVAQEPAQGVAFASGEVPTYLPPGSIGCTIVDPSRAPSWRPAPNVDRPACANTAVAPARDLWRVQGNDLAMTLRFAGASQTGLGMLRGLMTYDDALNLGPLQSWQLHGEAQLNAASLFDAVAPLEERARLALSPPSIAGWGLRFEAGGVAQGIDPVTAPHQNLEVAAEAQRSFTFSRLGRPHSIKLRVARESVQDLLDNSLEEKTSATIGYSHVLDFGTIGAELDIARKTPGYAAETVNDARVAVSFSRPF